MNILDNFDIRFLIRTILEDGVIICDFIRLRGSKDGDAPRGDAIYMPY